MQSEALIEELEHKVGGSFRRAFVYPLYYDPDHIVQGHPLSQKQIPLIIDQLFIVKGSCLLMNIGSEIQHRELGQ